MKAIALIISLLATVAASAMPIDQQADSAYAADDFLQAAALYRQIMATEGTSAQLYYNLGNCEYRLGRPGQAILNYERALRIDPTFSDARTNLDFVNARIVDRQGERGSFLSNAFNRVSLTMSTNAWATTAFIIFFAMAAGIACYFFAGNIALRKVGFFGAILLFLLFIAAIILAFKAKSIADDTSTAIITSPSTILSTSPREPKDRNEEAMMLHEGTKVTILDSISVPGDTTRLKWLDVQIDNAHRAWIKSTDVERIR